MNKQSFLRGFDKRYDVGRERELLIKLAEAATEDVSLRLQGKAVGTPSHAVYGPLLDLVNEWQEFKIGKKKAVAEYQEHRKTRDFKHSNMERKEIYKIEEVLPFALEVSKRDGRDEMRDYHGDPINMASERYKCFNSSGLKCVMCGIEGKFFAKERSKSQDSIWHFNLYAINDEGYEILMTKDHIVPRSKGGKDHVSNYQTMCNPCNTKKADIDLEAHKKAMAEKSKAGMERAKAKNLIERMEFTKAVISSDASDHSSQQQQSPKPQS